MNESEYINHLKQKIDSYRCGASLKLSANDDQDMGWACFFTNGEEFGSEYPKCIFNEEILFAWVYAESCYPSTLIIEAEINEVGKEKDIEIYHSKLQLPIAAHYDNNQQRPYNYKCTSLKRDKPKYKKDIAVLACNLFEILFGIHFRKPRSVNSMDISIDL